MNTPTIDVYCQEPSHAERRWDIGQFVLDIPDPDEPLHRIAADAGIPVEPMWVFGDPHSLVVRMRGIRRSRAWVAPDGHYITPEEMTSKEDALEGAHLRWRLHCELCGLTYERRAEKLTPILNRLAEAGVSVIALSTLGATMGRKLG